METPFSALIAVVVWRQFLGRRAAAAMMLIVGAASPIALDGSCEHRAGNGANFGGFALVTLAPGTRSTSAPTDMRERCAACGV